MKKVLFLCAGLTLSAMIAFGQEIPKLKVTERDMTGVIFRCVNDNETVVEVQSNLPLSFDSTIDKEITFCDTKEENGFFFYQLLFATTKKFDGRKLKIKSYGFDTHIQALNLKEKVPVGFLVINETKFKADNFYNEEKYREALKEYEKLYSINPKDIYVEGRINLCNKKIDNSNISKTTNKSIMLKTEDIEKEYVVKQYINGTYKGYVRNEKHGQEGTFGWTTEKRHGQGTFIWNNGDRYDGDYANDMMSGKGKLRSPSGKFRYEGTFEKNKFNGWGIYYHDDGWRHEGYFKDGQPHGEGTRYDKKGKVQRKGIWENGEFKSK